MSDSHIRRRAKKSLDCASEACLTALTEVLSYRASSWTKYDLAHWLRGPYAEASCPHTDTSTDDDDEDQEGPPSGSVDGDRLHYVLQSARLGVRELLRNRGMAFDAEADALLARGSVIELCDESGGFWFAPVSKPRMRLEERILSLAVAYYLMRPEELESPSPSQRVDPRAEIPASGAVAVGRLRDVRRNR
jgi:hypothetical protein